jgi:hypothetical protein
MSRIAKLRRQRKAERRSSADVRKRRNRSSASTEAASRLREELDLRLRTLRAVA